MESEWVMPHRCYRHIMSWICYKKRTHSHKKAASWAFRCATSLFDTWETDCAYLWHAIICSDSLQEENSLPQSCILSIDWEKVSFQIFEYVCSLLKIQHLVWMSHLFSMFIYIKALKHWFMNVEFSHTQRHTHTHIHTYTHIYTYIHTYTQTHSQTYAHARIHIHTHPQPTHTRTHTMHAQVSKQHCIVLTSSTSSFVWHDALISLTQLIHVRDITTSSVWYDSFISVTWLIHQWDRSLSSAWNDSWLLLVWDMTLYASLQHWLQHIHVTWLLHMCDMIHSSVRYVSIVCMIWLLLIRHTTFHESLQHLVQTPLQHSCNTHCNTHCNKYMWRGSFIGVMHRFQKSQTRRTRRN